MCNCLHHREFRYKYAAGDEDLVGCCVMVIKDEMKQTLQSWPLFVVCM